MYKEAGQPLPKFSNDDVLNFLVTEAIIVKYAKEQDDARKHAEYERKREEFKNDGGLQQRVDEANAVNR